MEMLIDLYEKVLGKCPQKGITFIRENGQRNRLTYAEIAEKAVARGAFLKDSGCRPKDFLIFQIYDDQEFLIHFWACIFSGSDESRPGDSRCPRGRRNFEKNLFSS